MSRRPSELNAQAKDGGRNSHDAASRDQSLVDTVRQERASELEDSTATSSLLRPANPPLRRSGVPRSDAAIGPAAPEVQQTHSRLDAISGRWTLFAAQRNERPNEYVTRSMRAPSADGCPFCEGNEEQTPAPVVVITAAEDADSLTDGDGDASWGIRVIPNKFPAVDSLRGDLASGSPSDHNEALVADVYPEGQFADRTRRCAVDRAVEGGESSLFRSRRTLGGHEVFIESPDHFASICDMDLSRVVSLLQVYQTRMEYWAARRSIQYVSLFKNAGPEAGASLHHPHSQLIALSDLPQAVRTVVDRMRLHHARTGCCLQCDVLRAELKSKRRIVAVTDSLVAYCPYASHLPMMLRVTTRRHVDRFERLNEQEIDELARLIRRSVGWLKSLYPDVAYNYLFNTRPPLVNDKDAYHWSFELFPRLNQIAGFEWSCDLMINPTLPEFAATQLRAVAMQENPMR